MASHCSMASLRTSKLLRIDSKDRNVASNSQYDFTIDMNDYMLHNIKRVILKSIFLPNTAYNINTYNNQLTYNDGTDKTITVPVGQYNITDLLDEMIVQFAAETPAVTMTYVINSTTRKIELTFGSAIILKASSTIAQYIGMNPDTDTASLTVHDLPFIYNLTGLQKVYIGSHAIAKGTTMTSSDKSHIKIFTEIPITVNFGEVEHRVQDNLESVDEVTHSIPFNLSSNIDITLYDENLNIVDLNGLDFQMVLKVFQ